MPGKNTTDFEEATGDALLDVEDEVDDEDDVEEENEEDE